MTEPLTRAETATAHAVHAARWLAYARAQWERVRAADLPAGIAPPLAALAEYHRGMDWHRRYDRSARSHAALAGAGL